MSKIIRIKNNRIIFKNQTILKNEIKKEKTINIKIRENYEL